MNVVGKEVYLRINQLLLALEAFLGAASAGSKGTASVAKGEVRIIIEGNLLGRASLAAAQM